MIDFEHGALRGRGEPELAGLGADRVLPRAAAQSLSLVAEAGHLLPPTWLALLTEARSRRRTRLHAVVRSQH